MVNVEPLLKIISQITYANLGRFGP